MRYLLIILFIWLNISASSQTLGGNSVFNFLKLSNTPQLTALGGVNISQPSNDLGMVFNNPSLLKPSMHTQMNAVFNSFYSDIKVYHLALAYTNQNIKTNFSWGLNYFNYGNVAETDASGNVYGKFHPVDWVMQVSASRNYLDKWNYGATIKYISSNYGVYKSNGVALDVGVLFSDTSRHFTASVVAKNLGAQLKKYEGSSVDELPFDFQVGLTKKMASAPFSFSLTSQHLQKFNISYNDTSFNNENGYGSTGSFGRKLFDHLILASTLYIGKSLEAIVGYNFLRRKELNIGNNSNGLNGFSLGIGALFGKLQLRYARAYFQNNSAFNQLGLNLTLREYFGLKRFGDRIGW